MPLVIKRVALNNVSYRVNIKAFQINTYDLVQTLIAQLKHLDLTLPVQRIVVISV